MPFEWHLHENGTFLWKMGTKGARTLRNPLVGYQPSFLTAYNFYVWKENQKCLCKFLLERDESENFRAGGDGTISLEMSTFHRPSVRRERAHYSHAVWAKTLFVRDNGTKLINTKVLIAILSPIITNKSRAVTRISAPCIV